MSYTTTAMTAPSYTYQRLVVGYHGCDRSVVESVLLDDTPLSPSRNNYDWLGEGIYFWEHGAKRAMEFARWKQGRGDIKEASVLGAYIHLGNCFDLTDTTATRTLRYFYDRVQAMAFKDGIAMPENLPGGSDDHDLVRRFLDCAVLNLALETNQKIQTVRGVFVEGEEAYPGAGIHLKTHVQIAVREPGCILGYFKPNFGYTE